MLNRAEFKQLQSPLLSHMARTLYVFYLQPTYAQGHIKVDPIALCSKLVSYSTLAPCTPSLQDIEEALEELEQVGIIERVQGQVPWQNALLSLPLYEEEKYEYPLEPFRMTDNWQPGPGFRHAALMSGLIDYTYNDNELLDFVNYWASQNVTRNQSSWESSFIKRLLKLRYASSTKFVTKRESYGQFAASMRRSEQKDKQNNNAQGQQVEPAQANAANQPNNGFYPDAQSEQMSNMAALQGSSINPALQSCPPPRKQNIGAFVPTCNVGSFAPVSEPKYAKSSHRSDNPIVQMSDPKNAAYAVKRPSIRSMYTGEAEYDLYAKGYSGPNNPYTQKDNSGYQTAKAAPNYTPRLGEQDYDPKIHSQLQNQGSASPYGSLVRGVHEVNINGSNSANNGANQATVEPPLPERKGFGNDFLAELDAEFNLSHNQEALSQNQASSANSQAAFEQSLNSAPSGNQSGSQVNQSVQHGSEQAMEQAAPVFAQEQHNINAAQETMPNNASSSPTPNSSYVRVDRSKLKLD